MMARYAALYLARCEAGASLLSIAQWLGYRSSNSASTALTRFRRRLVEPEVWARLERTRAKLYKVET